MVAGHCSAAVVRWCRAGPGGGPGRLVAALPGRSVQIVTRAFVPAVIKFPSQKTALQTRSREDGKIKVASPSHTLNLIVV